MGGEGITWAVVATAEAVLLMGAGGLIWNKVSNTLAEVSEKMVEVAVKLHGHDIRLDHLEKHHGK